MKSLFSFIKTGSIHIPGRFADYLYSYAIFTQTAIFTTDWMLIHKALLKQILMQSLEKVT